MEYIFYKINCIDDNIPYCYIGSTKDFASRKWAHKSACKNPRKKNIKLYTEINNNGGWDNWKIAPIGRGIFNSRLDARIEEQKYMNDNISTLNTIKAILSEEDEKNYKKQWTIDNIEKVKESKKKYRDANKAKLAEICKNNIDLQNKRKEKTLCDCGGSYVYTHKAEHMRSKKHTNHINIIDV